MKTIIITILSAITLNSFAGILENRRTGETIEFVLDRRSQTVEILSTAGGVPNTTLSIHTVDGVKRKKKNLYGLTKATYEGTDAHLFLAIPATVLIGAAVGSERPVLDSSGNQMKTINGSDKDHTGQGALIGLGVGAFIAYGAPAILDTLLLPVKALKNSAHRKDRDMLNRAVNSTEVVSVNKKRFNRIKNILKKALN